MRVKGFLDRISGGALAAQFSIDLLIACEGLPDQWNLYQAFAFSNCYTTETSAVWYFSGNTMK